MAWNSGYFVCSYSLVDYDNARTSFRLRLPGATALADAVAFLTGFADLLKAACNVKVERAAISQVSIPDGVTTLVQTAQPSSDIERKAVFKMQSEANALADIKYSFFDIPTLFATEVDDQVPAEYVVENDGRGVNLNTANTDVAGIYALLAPAVPDAATVQACNINRQIFTDVVYARKKTRAGDSADDAIAAG